jgi:dipeptidase E
MAGGGDDQDSILLDQRFARDIESKRMLYLPIAMSGVSPTYEECYAWIQGVFNPLGVTEIVMWDSLDGKQRNDLRMFDAVYIGGGNTFKLLYSLMSTGFDDDIKDYIGNGGIVYGGSAGAIILGYDISTCAVMDSNDVGLLDTLGLGLIGNYAIWCHYAEEHDSLIIQQKQPIVAIPEQSGVVFDGGSIHVVGFEPVCVFDKGSKYAILPDKECHLSIICT